MSCAVQLSQVEKFFTPNFGEPDFEDYPNLNKRIIMTKHACVSKSRTRPTVTDMKDACKSKTQTTEESSKCSGTSSKEEGGKKKEGEGKKKKKKWKKLALADTGFNLSLFPRPTTATATQEEEEKRAQKLDRELEAFEELLNKCEDFIMKDRHVLDGTVCGLDSFRRRDRHQRMRKAGKQVKDKYCRTLKNNDGRKKLFIHHRLFKLINLEERRMTFLPSPKLYSRNIVNNKSTHETRSKLKSQRSEPRSAPVQNLRHTLHQTNAPTEMETNLLNLLISLQHREVTPEDYELLLQLDESVAPKTVDKSALASFKMDNVTDNTVGDVCPVCMDQYELGQSRKFLPCNHVFHASCIDMWLENSSRNCPVDGLPVDTSS